MPDFEFSFPSINYKNVCGFWAVFFIIGHKFKRLLYAVRLIGRSCVWSDDFE